MQAHINCQTHTGSTYTNSMSKNEQNISSLHQNVQKSNAIAPTSPEAGALQRILQLVYLCQSCIRSASWKNSHKKHPDPKRLYIFYIYTYKKKEEKTGRKIRKRNKISSRLSGVISLKPPQHLSFITIAVSSPIYTENKLYGENSDHYCSGQTGVTCYYKLVLHALCKTQPSNHHFLQELVLSK